MDDHHHHHHHGGGHSVVKIVKGKSPEMAFFEFIMKFKKSIWIILGIGCLSAVLGYFMVLNHHPGVTSHIPGPKPVVKPSKPGEPKSIDYNNNGNFRNDRKAGGEEILKWKNTHNKQ